DFPRTLDQRVYHLGLRAGEVANRIITVGSPSRAGSIASFLDAEPKPFRITSERGFLTITGRYKGVPVSICSIGMGHPNMDFFVREVRECLSGDMIVVRLGSCGCLLDHPVGTIVVPKACVAVSRNYDYDFGIGNSPEPPYRISKPIAAGFQQPDALSRVLSDVVNASADSFYSSQGRQTSFPDHNQDLIPTLLSSIPGLATLEVCRLSLPNHRLLILPWTTI
ncbi:purine and uridine phosphorylase, partial [Gloeophyllum trabeum ATCC 11539]